MTITDPANEILATMHAEAVRYKPTEHNEVGIVRILSGPRGTGAASHGTMSIEAAERFAKDLLTATKKAREERAKWLEAERTQFLLGFGAKTTLGDYVNVMNVTALTSEEAASFAFESHGRKVADVLSDAKATMWSTEFDPDQDAAGHDDMLAGTINAAWVEAYSNHRGTIQVFDLYSA